MQIVGYETNVGDGPAALVLATDEGIDRVPLERGTTLDLGLGPRRCAGEFVGEEHVSCDRDDAPYCEEHTSRWPCARCTGNCTMPTEACHEEHAIYLAAFAPSIVKVGVTRSWRLETRLREQGADRAAHVRTVENGRRARQIEAELATRLTDRVRIPEKIAGLHRSVDEDAWSEVLDDFEVNERFAFDYPFSLDQQPVAETLARGTVLGTKGRILVLERDGTTYAVDLRDLVGHEIRTEPTIEKRQSSLGAFE